MSHIPAICTLVAVTAAWSPANAEDDLVVTARPSTPLDLPAVLEVALRGNPALTRLVIDIDLARADELAARGLDDFKLTADAAYRFNRLHSDQYGMRLPDGANEHLLSLDAGLERNLSSGGQVRAGATVAYGVPETLSDNLQTALSLRFLQPILRGRGYNVARADVRRAHIARDVATLRQAAEALDLLRRVIDAYWRVAYARQVVTIRLEALKLATQQKEITERAVRTGSVSPTEVVSAEQAIAVRQEAALQAQVELSQLSLSLRQLAGLELTPNVIDLEPTSQMTDVREVDVAAVLARALAENPQLALLKAKAKGADVDIEVASNAMKPRFDVFASVGAMSNDRDASRAVLDLVEAHNPTATIGISYEQSLGSHAAKGAYERARAQRRGVDIDLQLAQRELSVAVTHAVDLMRAARQRLTIGDRAIALAQKNFEVEQTRFLNGKSTNFNVLLRQDELQKAKVTRAQAAADGLAAEAALDSLTGDLLARHHVKVVAP